MQCFVAVHIHFFFWHVNNLEIYMMIYSFFSAVVAISCNVSGAEPQRLWSRDFYNHVVVVNYHPHNENDLRLCGIK